MDTTDAGVAAAPENASDREALAYKKHFEGLYADWLAARARINENVPGDGPEHDEELDSRIFAAVEAARRFMVFPAVSEWQVWAKLELFEHYFDSETHIGPRFDKLATAIFGCLKADLLACGIDKRDAPA